MATATPPLPPRRVDLSRRSVLPELMDDPEVPTAEMARALDELEVINRWLGGHAASRAGLRRLLPARPSDLSVLDVGCGGGEGLRGLVAAARRLGHRCRGTGIDRSSAVIACARSRAASERLGEDVRFEVADLFDLEDRSHDVVHAALLLHHLDGDDAPRALEKLVRVARRGVVINDLHRHAFAYHSIGLLTRALSRSRLVRHDASLSVARAFRRRDWREMERSASGVRLRVSWRWAFRWVVTASRRERGGPGR